MSAREADDGEICVEFCLQGVEPVQVPSSAGLLLLTCSVQSCGTDSTSCATYWKLDEEFQVL